MPRPTVPDRKRRIPYAIRLRPSILAALRAKAEGEGVAPATLAARLIRQGLRDTPRE